MAQVTVRMDGDELRLLKSMSKVIKKEQEMAAKFRDVGNVAKRSGKQTEQSFGGKTLASLKSYGAGLISITAGLGLVNSLLADQKRLAEDAAKAQVKLGKAQQDAIKNLTGLTPEQKAETLAAADRIQRETKFPDQVPLTNAIGAGFSASGDRAKTEEAVKQAAKLTRLSPDDVGTVSAGALDVSRGSGLTDAERNLGFLLSAGSTARIEDPAKLSTSLAPVVSSGVDTVPEQERTEAGREIAAIFGTLTKAATDTEGKSTATATTQLLSKMAQFFKDRPDDPGTIFGRLDVLQADPKLAEEFFGKQGFGEEKFKQPFRQLLQAGSDLEKEVEANKKLINFDAAVFRANVEEISKLTPQLRIANAEAASQGNLQAAEMDPTLGARAQIRKTLTDTLDKVRATPLDLFSNKFNEFKFDVQTQVLGRDPAEVAADLLDKRRQDFAFTDEFRQERSPEVKASLQTLRRQEEVIRGLGEQPAFSPIEIRGGKVVPIGEAGGAFNVRDVPMQELRPRPPADLQEAKRPSGGGFDHQQQSPAAGVTSDALVRSLDRATAAMELSAKAQLVSASAPQSSQPAHTPHRPSSRAAQLAQRNAHRE
ncbi:MAG: hypothetical protein KY475_25505 [Planctomycetes bacterium]|nr:hypothetical protein [Planctomycetota bacterium]